MSILRYKVISPVRLLLPISVVFLILPWCYDELLTVYTFPIFYFFAPYFILINFPSFGEILHGKPTYVEDLVMDTGTIDDHWFFRFYNNMMTLILSVLSSGFAFNFIIHNIHKRPIIEILAIIGGNLSLYNKVQNYIGKGLLFFCHSWKIHQLNEINKRKMSDEVELNQTDKKPA